MPPGAIVEADVAKTEMTKELHIKIELDEVCEVETLFSRRHDVVGADGANKNRDDVEISILMFTTFEEPIVIYSIDNCSRPQ